MLKYIELKSGYTDDGPAWIGTVKQSKSGRTIYFNGKALGRGNGVSGNHYDVETGEEYWVSNVKKNGEDRHWAGKGKIEIESAVVNVYLEQIGKTELSKSKYKVVEAFLETDISKFEEVQNEQLKREPAS